jgi:hypothetical protein
VVVASGEHGLEHALRQLRVDCFEGEMPTSLIIAATVT